MDEFELVKAMILTMVKIHLWGVEVEHLDRAGFSFKIPCSTLNNKDKVKFIHDQVANYANTVQFSSGFSKGDRLDVNDIYIEGKYYRFDVSTYRS